MYRLVIVEDEERIRHSLEKLIPWEKMGFEVVRAFSDGMDALKYLQDNSCDAVLTDIMMNRMTGLEMIEQLCKLHPRLKIVILSGYSDFAYAQRAIQYKVVNYLVKPVDEEELMNTFGSIKEQLDLEREETLIADMQTRELKHMLQKNFFEQLLSGHIISDDELSAYLKTLGMEKVRKEEPLFAFEITERSNQDESAQDGVGAALEDVLENLLVSAEPDLSTYLIEEKNDCWHLVVVGTEQLENETARKRFHQQMQAFACQLSSALENQFTFRVTHCVSQLSDLLTGAKMSSDLQITLPKPEMDSRLYNEVLSEYKLLIVELDIGGKETLHHLLDGLFRKLEDAPLEDVRFILRNLYSVMESHYKKRKIDPQAVTNGRFDVSRLYRPETTNEIAACVTADFDALCDGLKTCKCESRHSTIQHIVAYLNDHISEEIGHEAIAQKYRMHPGYLSRLFKQEMGETLSEYLLRIKTEKAAVLLKEGQYKVGEIAEMVGCNASSYFSIMFKKNTGYSPREYSQKVSL